LIAVDVERLDPLVLGRHQFLFDGGWTVPGADEPYIRSYDIAPDGEHFVMIRYEPAAIPDRIDIVN